MKRTPKRSNRPSNCRAVANKLADHFNIEDKYEHVMFADIGKEPRYGKDASLIEFGIDLSDGNTSIDGTILMESDNKIRSVTARLINERIDGLTTENMSNTPLKTTFYPKSYTELESFIVALKEVSHGMSNIKIANEEHCNIFTLNSNLNTIHDRSVDSINSPTKIKNKIVILFSDDVIAHLGNIKSEIDYFKEPSQHIGISEKNSIITYSSMTVNDYQFYFLW